MNYLLIVKHIKPIIMQFLITQILKFLKQIIQQMKMIFIIVGVMKQIIFILVIVKLNPKKRVKFFFVQEKIKIKNMN